MPTITRKNRATLSHIVDIALAADEQIATIGDRRRGSMDRKPARITGYHLRFEWNTFLSRWTLDGSHSQTLVQQQRQDDTWGEPAPRTNTYESRDALEAAYAPTGTPEVTWDGVA